MFQSSTNNRPRWLAYCACLLIASLTMGMPHAGFAQSANDSGASVGATDAEQTTSKNSKKKKKKAKRKKVCKKVKVTGTHFRKRICQSQEAWDELERDAQRTATDLDNRRN